MGTGSSPFKLFALADLLKQQDGQELIFSQNQLTRPILHVPTDSSTWGHFMLIIGRP